MSAYGKLKAAIVALLSLTSITLSACQTVGTHHQAGAEIGRAAAGVELPPWPAHCRQPVPHASVAVGEDAIGILQIERAQLDFANQRAANCGAHYDRLEAGLEGR